MFIINELFQSNYKFCPTGHKCTLNLTRVHVYWSNYLSNKKRKEYKFDKKIKESLKFEQWVYFYFQESLSPISWKLPLLTHSLLQHLLVSKAVNPFPLGWNMFQTVSEHLKLRVQGCLNVSKFANKVLTFYPQWLPNEAHNCQSWKYKSDQTFTYYPSEFRNFENLKAKNQVLSKRRGYGESRLTVCIKLI